MQNIFQFSCFLTFCLFYVGLAVGLGGPPASQAMTPLGHTEHQRPSAEEIWVSSFVLLEYA